MSIIFNLERMYFPLTECRLSPARATLTSQENSSVLASTPLGIMTILEQNNAVKVVLGRSLWRQ